ncbi:MAG: preprotein translocase subunit SecE [Candidatus Magasanikbacteria bacterium]|nr:preprotein translocase subunit SecE [Candidatus Magasanikbacteria bacterium]
MSVALKIKTYFIESVVELKKVVWPSKKQTTTYTILVVVMSVGVAIFFAVLDYIFNRGLQTLIK